MVRWLPNTLTAARLVAVAPFTVLLARADDALSTGAAVLFAVAASTDFLDGYLARQAHVQSRFGRIVDPLADRLLINLALILLVYHQRLEWWLAAPVLLRDALLAALFRARHEATEVRVNLTGKAATAAIMLSLFLLMLVDGGWPKVVFALGLVLSVLAGAKYVRPHEGGLESKPS
ncbi:MAG TPA: CDP-alcohol phosphatidyltransferase family protein [Gaiellales bacterium]